MSSTLKGAIDSLKTRIAAAYAAIVEKGGTLPATQDSANLPAAIASIPSGGENYDIEFNVAPNSYQGLFYNKSALGQLNSVFITIGSNTTSLLQSFGSTKFKEMYINDDCDESNIVDTRYFLSDTNVEYISKENWNLTSCLDASSMFLNTMIRNANFTFNMPVSDNTPGISGMRTDGEINVTFTALKQGCKVSYLTARNIKRVSFANDIILGSIYGMIGGSNVEELHLPIVSGVGPNDWRSFLAGNLKTFTIVSAPDINNEWMLASPLLSHDSILNLLNALPNTTTHYIKIGATNLAKLTDAEKQIATDKGWTLSA